MKIKFDVPAHIKVGFQNRNDTYTKKLGYMIPSDDVKSTEDKTVWKQETSWTTWSNKDIEPLIFDNEVTEGFIINKNVGGGRGWDHRNAYIRILHPKGFEFEISVENLLFILDFHEIKAGKAIEGNYILVWENTKPFLLPIATPEYQAYLALDITGKEVTKVIYKPGTFFRFPKTFEVCEFIGRGPFKFGAYGEDFNTNFKGTRSLADYYWNHDKAEVGFEFIYSWRKTKAKSSIRGIELDSGKYPTRAPITLSKIQTFGDFDFVSPQGPTPENSKEMQCYVDVKNMLAESNDLYSSTRAVPVYVTETSDLEQIRYIRKVEIERSFGDFRDTPILHIDRTNNICTFCYWTSDARGTDSKSISFSAPVGRRGGWSSGGSIWYSFCEVQFPYSGELDIDPEFVHSKEDVFSFQKGLEDKLLAATGWTDKTIVFFWDQLESLIPGTPSALNLLAGRNGNTVQMKPYLEYRAKK